MVLDKKALNLEMLKIAGFTLAGGIWSYPDGVDVDDGVPFFPEDETACFKWITPKLYELGFWMQWYLDANGCDVRIHHLNSQDNYSIYQDKTPALAFCLAMRKLK